MSKNEPSGLPPGRARRESPGDEETPSVDSLDSAAERELAARVKLGDAALEAVLTALMPKLETSLRRQNSTPFDAAKFIPSIRDGLRDALLEHCPNGQPGDGLLPRALLRIRERVSVFLDGSAHGGPGAAFNGH